MGRSVGKWVGEGKRQTGRERVRVYAHATNAVVRPLVYAYVCRVGKFFGNPASAQCMRNECRLPLSGFSLEWTGGWVGGWVRWEVSG